MAGARVAFQDRIPELHCFGCGPDNPGGLRIKSYWGEEGEAVCSFTPEPHHCAAPREVINGGILATLIDCHSICTAMADGYAQEERDIGSEPAVFHVTGSLSIRYLRPAPMGCTLEAVARITERTAKKTVLTCTVSAAGEPCAAGEVVAIRVPPDWAQRHGG